MEKRTAKRSPGGVSRRDFIKGMGTGALGTAVIPELLGQSIATRKGRVPVYERKTVALTVNGRKVGLEVEANETLLEVLRDKLDLTGAKKVCDRGECGGCTVLLDGAPVYACMYLAVRADGRTVKTVEGLADGDKLHPVQEAFIEKDGYQCGFCTPGFLMTTSAFLETNPAPSPDEIKQALAGNLCRCGNYAKICGAVEAAAKKMKGRDMRAKAYTSYARGGAAGQARPAAQKPAPKPEAPAAEAKAPEFKLIGRPTARVDGREIVTGRAKFTHDVRLQGMLVGKILRSPRAAAEVVSVDLAPALALPGVLAALKLADGKVRYAGQQVAAVAAVDERTAEKALALIKVEYKTLPAVVDWEKARDPNAPQVRDGKPNVDKLNEYARGDVAKGFAEADVVVEKTYRTAFEVHNPTETHGSVAAWEGDHLTVYDSTQGVHGVRDGLARALKVPAANVTVIKNYMGGGFGSKLSTGEYTVVAARLARETGRPVKILLSRRDNALCVGYRPSSFQTYKVGAKKDGTLLAFSLLNYASGGIVPGDEVSEPVVDLYKCPNCKVEEHTVYTNTGAQRAMRAPGHTPGAFGLESVMDELAAALDMDPLELRRKNLSTKNLGDTGLPYSSKGLDKCYDLGAEAIGWERRNRKPGDGAGTGPLRRGIGCASSLWFGAGVPGTLADLVLYPDGSVEIVCGTQDIGCGTRTHMAVVVAETLGLEPKDVTVKLGNSDYPWAPISGGSLTTPSVAPAVRDAALKAVERLKDVAAARLKIEPGDVVMAGRKFSSKSDPAKSATFAEVYRDLRRETVFHGERGPMDEEKYAFNTFGAHFAEVEVDVETGRVRVLKYVAAQDSGRIVSRLTAESQVIGGVTQGLGAALYEERVLDDATGTVVNPNLRDYKVPTSLDIPEITPLFADVVDPHINNLGVKGLGEPARVPASPAIANAVFNAIGVHVREIPMTPKRVLDAFRRKESGS